MGLSIRLWIYPFLPRPKTKFFWQMVTFSDTLNTPPPRSNKHACKLTDLFLFIKSYVVGEWVFIDTLDEYNLLYSVQCGTTATMSLTMHRSCVNNLVIVTKEEYLCGILHCSLCYLQCFLEECISRIQFGLLKY